MAPIRSSDSWSYYVVCVVSAPASSTSGVVTLVQRSRMLPHWNTYSTLQRRHGLCYRPALCIRGPCTPYKCAQPFWSFVLAFLLHFTASGVRPMVTTSLRSVATCSTQRSSARLITHSTRLLPAKANLSKPRLQMQRLQSLLMKQVASILPQTSSRITPGTQTQGQRAI